MVAGLSREYPQQPAAMPRAGRRRRLKLLPVCLLLLLTARPSSAERFWGQVVSSTGTPVPRPLVQVKGQGAVLGDGRGYFALVDVPLGELQVLIEAAGHLPLRRRIYQSRESARVFELLPLASDGQSPDPLLRGELDGSGAGRRARMALDLNRDGLPEGWQGEERTLALLDGRPLSSPLGYWATPLEEAALWGPGQWQSSGKDAFLFRGGLLESRHLPRSWNLSPEVLQPATLRPQAFSFQLSGGTGGRGGSSFESWFRPGFNRVERLRLEELRAPGDGGRNRDARLSLLDRLVLPGLLLEQGLQFSRQQLQAPLPWEGEQVLLDHTRGRQSGRSVEYGARALSMNSDGFRMRLDLQLGGRWQQLERMEEDLLFRRGEGSAAEGTLTSSAWFNSERRRRLLRQACALSLVLPHDRGLFELGFFLDFQQRLQEGSLKGSPQPELDPRGNWYGLKDRRNLAGLRLADRYQVLPDLALDAGFAARYSNYVFERLATPLFPASQQIEFDDALLALEPQIGLLWTPGARHSLSLAWLSSRRPLDPEDYWDGDLPPHVPGTSPLFDSDLFGAAVPLLGTEKRQLWSLVLQQRLYTGSLHAELHWHQVERRSGMGLRENRGSTLRPLRASGGRYERLHSRLAWEPTHRRLLSVDLALEGTWTRWREGWFIHPLEDRFQPASGRPMQDPDPLYYDDGGRYELRRLRGLEVAGWPRLQARIGLQSNCRLGPWSLEARLEALARSAYAVDIGLAAASRLDALRQLDLHVQGLRQAGPFRLSLALRLRNLLDAKGEQAGVYTRFQNREPVLNSTTQTGRIALLELGLGIREGAGK